MSHGEIRKMIFYFGGQGVNVNHLTYMGLGYQYKVEYYMKLGFWCIEMISRLPVLCSRRCTFIYVSYFLLYGFAGSLHRNSNSYMDY